MYLTLLSSFYVKSQISTWNRANKCFYYERTALNIYYTVSENLSGVISIVPLSGSFWNYPSEQNHVQS